MNIFAISKNAVQVFSLAICRSNVEIFSHLFAKLAKAFRFEHLYGLLELVLIRKI